MITDLLQEQPKFAEMTDFGNQLTKEACVGLEERVKIQKGMQSLHERWDALYESATSRHDRYWVSSNIGFALFEKKLWVCHS